MPGQPVEQVQVFEREVEEGVGEGPLQHVAVLARLQLHQRRQAACALGVLARGRAQQEEAAHLPPVVAALLPPRAADELAPVVVGGRRLDRQQQEDPVAARALGWRVPEQGKVVTVAVPQEVLDACGQLLEVDRGVDRVVGHTRGP